MTEKSDYKELGTELDKYYTRRRNIQLRILYRMNKRIKYTIKVYEKEDEQLPSDKIPLVQEKIHEIIRLLEEHLQAIASVREKINVLIKKDSSNAEELESFENNLLTLIDQQFKPKSDGSNSVYYVVDGLITELIGLLDDLTEEGMRGIKSAELFEQQQEAKEKEEENNRAGSSRSVDTNKKFSSIDEAKRKLKEIESLESDEEKVSELKKIIQFIFTEYKNVDKKENIEERMNKLSATYKDLETRSSNLDKEVQQGVKNNDEKISPEDKDKLDTELKDIFNDYKWSWKRAEHWTYNIEWVHKRNQYPAEIIDSLAQNIQEISNKADNYNRQINRQGVNKIDLMSDFIIKVSTKCESFLEDIKAYYSAMESLEKAERELLGKGRKFEAIENKISEMERKLNISNEEKKKSEGPTKADELEKEEEILEEEVKKGEKASKNKEEDFKKEIEKTEKKIKIEVAEVVEDKGVGIFRLKPKEISEENKQKLLPESTLQKTKEHIKGLQISKLEFEKYIDQQKNMIAGKKSSLTRQKNILASMLNEIHNVEGTVKDKAYYSLYDKRCNKIYNIINDILTITDEELKYKDLVKKEINLFDETLEKYKNLPNNIINYKVIEDFMNKLKNTFSTMSAYHAQLRDLQTRFVKTQPRIKNMVSELKNRYNILIKKAQKGHYDSVTKS